MDELRYDLIVVGSGTGLLGALTAAEEGLSVLVVEKSAVVGGSTSLSGGGFWIPGNSILREEGVVDDAERLRTYLRAATKGEVPEERWLTHVLHGPDAVESLRRNTPLKYQWMREYADYFPELPGGSAKGRAVEPRPFDARTLGEHRTELRGPVLEPPFPMPITSRAYRWMNLMTRNPRGVVVAGSALGLGLGGKVVRREYVAGGQALAAGLYAGVLRAKIPVWLNSPLRELVVGEGGQVTGVVVQRGGVDVVVHATRGVLLSAGGFDRNAEMRHRYQAEGIDTDWSFGNPDNTGDAIAAAAAIGADLAFMSESWWFPAIMTPDGTPGALLAERSLPGQIIVNGRGRRFMNEAVNYMSAGQIIWSKDTPEDPHVPAWMIFDQTFKNRYMFGTVVMPRRPLPKAWYDAGLAHKAKTVEDLADAVGLPDLPATVARFNVLAAAGRDDDFHRGDSAYDRYYGDPSVTPNPCLGPVRTGPFYAVRMVPGDLGTCGGVRADHFARALRADGTVIEGLYASGNAAGNAFGRCYPGPGATIGQGLVYAHVAARHAAKTLV